MKHVRRAALALTLGALPVHAAGCTPKPLGQIIVVVQTDMSIPKDVDTIHIDAYDNGTQVVYQDYQNIGPKSDPLNIQLPGTYTLVAAKNPDDIVTIVVSARSGGVPRVVCKVITTAPAEKTVLLPLGMHYLCYGQATLDPNLNTIGTCPDGQSCISGICADANVDSTTLPAYTADSVNGDGTCFDAASCWTAPDVAAVDLTDCTIPPVSEVNIALQTEGIGICGPVGCFVTLDSNDSTEGWSVRSDGRIALPPGVCVQLATKQIINVVTQPTSGACSVKKLSLPTCGPWSAASKNPPPYAGPQALAGGQARPVALTLQGGAVYWTNSGVNGKDGALKSVTPGGGTPVTVPNSSQAPRSMISLSNTLYWTDAPGTHGSGTIFESVLSSGPMGGKPTVKPLVTMLDSPEGIASASGLLFWTDFQDGAIFKSGLDGSTPAKLVGNANYPYRIVADGLYVYWTNEGTAGKTPPDGSVVRYQYTAANGTVETLADTQYTPRAVAIDNDGQATAVYWANFDEMHGTINRIKLTSPLGSIETLATVAYPNGIAVDGGYVYWTSRSDGSVYRLSTTAAAGTAPTAIATGQALPGTIATDSQYVYWVSEGSSSAETGAVVKIPKMP